MPSSTHTTNSKIDIGNLSPRLLREFLEHCGGIKIYKSLNYAGVYLMYQSFTTKTGKILDVKFASQLIGELSIIYELRCQLRINNANNINERVLCWEKLYSSYIFYDHYSDEELDQ